MKARIDFEYFQTLNPEKDVKFNSCRMFTKLNWMENSI